MRILAGACVAVRLTHCLQQATHSPQQACCLVHKPVLGCSCMSYRWLLTRLLCRPVLQVGCWAVLYGAWAAPQPNLGPRIYAYEVVQEYPHDPRAFTQGLEHELKCVMSPTGHPIPECSDILWESTGAAQRPAALVGEPCYACAALAAGAPCWHDRAAAGLLEGVCQQPVPDLTSRH